MPFELYMFYKILYKVFLLQPLYTNTQSSLFVALSLHNHILISISGAINVFKGFKTDLQSAISLNLLDLIVGDYLSALIFILQHDQRTNYRACSLPVKGSETGSEIHSLILVDPD